jgi:hypothetical protein
MLRAVRNGVRIVFVVAAAPGVVVACGGESTDSGGARGGWRARMMMGPLRMLAIAVAVVVALTGCGWKPVAFATPAATCAGGPPPCDPGFVAACVPRDAYPEAECRYLPRGNERVGVGSGRLPGAPNGAVVLCGWKCFPAGES